MLIRTRTEGAASTHAATIVYYNVSNSAWSVSPLSYAAWTRVASLVPMYLVLLYSKYAAWSTSDAAPYHAVALPWANQVASASCDTSRFSVAPTANRIRQADETMIFLHRQASLLFLYLINSAITTCYSYVCNCLLLHFIAGIIHLFRFFSAFICCLSSRAQSFIHRPARGSPQEQAYTSNARHNGWGNCCTPKRNVVLRFRNQREGHSDIINTQPAGNKTTLQWAGVLVAQSHLNVVPLRLLLVCVVACCLGPLYAMYPRAARHG